MSNALLALCKAEEFDRRLREATAFFYAKPTKRNAEKAKLKLQELFFYYYKLTPCHNTEEKEYLFMPKHKCVIDVYIEQYGAVAFWERWNAENKPAPNVDPNTDPKVEIDPLDEDAVDTIIGEEIIGDGDTQ